MESTSTNAEGVDIDELERALKAELEGVQLVGEIDVDLWGVRSELALRTRAHRCPPDMIRRLWPATLTTYLVHQGLHVYEHDGFWSQLSIQELRDGPAVGPEFERALLDLGLDTFDDIEAIEGIARDGRGRYIRRIHLHGGIPRASVGPVMRLLESSLRDGLTGAAEIVDSWSRLDLVEALHSKAAERCLTYARDFATTLVASLIELIRQANAGSVAAVQGVPQHLVEGVQEYVEQGRSKVGWRFSRGPLIGIDLHRGNPYLEVPEGREVVWSVNGGEVGVSSRRVRERFPLPLPDDGHWIVEADADEGVTVHGFSTELPPDTVLVFDGMGRLHRRGAVLQGHTVYVVGPGDLGVDSIDERSLSGEWAGLDLQTIDLRGKAHLEFAHSGSLHSIPIVNMPTIRIGRGRVEGITVDALEVLSGVVTIELDGFIPDLDQVMVRGPGGSLSLASAPRLSAAFDVTECLQSEVACAGTLVVAWGEETLLEAKVNYVPNLTVARPRLAPPNGDVMVDVGRTVDGRQRVMSYIVRGSASAARVNLGLLPGQHVERIEVNRLTWDLAARRAIAPILGTRRFSVRLPELHDHTLIVRTNGVPARVGLLGGSVAHEEPARLDRRHPTVRACDLRAFADTARRAETPTSVLAVLCPGEEPIEVGVIENRYETLWLHAEVNETADTRFLVVEWGERSEWPDREVRLWGRSLTEPVLVHAVQPGQSRSVVDVSSLHGGRYLVEVATNSPHAAPTRPIAGPVCQPIYVGSTSADRLRAAVEAGDRTAAFDDRELDDLVPLLADLLEEQRENPPDPVQRLALLERIADDNWRLIDVVAEIDDRFSDHRGSRPDLIEPFLTDLLPMAWVNPVTDAVADRLTDQVDHLWIMAPALAACLDRASPRSEQSFEECQQRWRRHAGLELSWGQSPHRRLDLLATQIPQPSKSTTPKGKGVGDPGWKAALGELTRSRVAHGESELYQHQRTLRGLERAVRNATSPPSWAGVVFRTAAAMKPYDKHCGWFVDLVRLCCELLDPKALATEAELLEALAAAQRVCPQATRKAVVFSAAALRLRHESGPSSKGAT